MVAAARVSGFRALAAGAAVAAGASQRYSAAAVAAAAKERRGAPARTYTAQAATLFPKRAKPLVRLPITTLIRMRMRVRMTAAAVAAACAERAAARAALPLYPTTPTAACTTTAMLVWTAALTAASAVGLHQPRNGGTGVRWGTAVTLEESIMLRIIPRRPWRASRW